MQLLAVLSAPSVIAVAFWFVAQLRSNLSSTTNL